MALRTGEIIASLYRKSPKWRQLDETELKKLKETMVSIADDVFEFCEKYGLQVCLAYGSALGAVRHKGFIPWDDDMDLYMPREDYEKFIDLASTEMTDKYYIRSVRTGLGVGTCHVRKKGTHYVNYGDLVLTANDPEETRGIYIDIFPLDNASNFSFLRWIKGHICLLILFAMSCVSLKDSVDYLPKVGVEMDKGEKQSISFKYFMGKIFSFYDIGKWAKLVDRFAARNKNSNSKYITCFQSRVYKDRTYLKSDIYPFEKMMFEGRKWNIPHNYDKYLRTQYGNYMELPKPEDRRTHPIFELEFE